jgi:hypothetical protein
VHPKGKHMEERGVRGLVDAHHTKLIMFSSFGGKGNPYIVLIEHSWTVRGIGVG